MQAQNWMAQKLNSLRPIYKPKNYIRNPKLGPRLFTNHVNGHDPNTQVESCSSALSLSAPTISMATITVDAPPPSSDRLSLESIPAVDLRCLTQSELTALSRCSIYSFDLSRCDDVVIPKIDRSVFNESAGSRKQTYSRLRLAPRKSDLSAAKPRPAPAPPDNPERAENSRIISLFKQLFDSASNGSELVAVNVEYSEVVPGNPNFAVSVGERHFSERKRKRGRKPKSEKLGGDVIVGGENKNKGLILYDENAQAREKELAKKNGVVVNLVELAGLEDPYGPEIRRRTEGLNGDEELLGFMSHLVGQWGSRRKRRRIVDANEFGDALPNGWKILIGMKKKQGQTWLFCRRYVSPNGRYFMSCKEVSSYLCSLRGLEDELPTSNRCSGSSQMENKSVSVEASAFRVHHVLSSATSQSDYNDNEKQITLANDVGVLKEARVFKCHKCSEPFHEKNGLLSHLLSCHKRKRRKAGMPLDDFELMRAGPYDCQFCSKTFYERSVFFAHVGIHVKSYLKSIGEPGEGACAEKASSPVPLREIHPSGSEMKQPIDIYGDCVAGTDLDTKGSGELVSDHNCDEKKSNSNIEGHVHDVDSEATKLSVDKERSMRDFRAGESVVGESFNKGENLPAGINNELGRVDRVGDNSVTELDFGAKYMTSSGDSIDTCGIAVNAKLNVISTATEKNEVQDDDGCLISKDDKSASTVNNDQVISKDTVNSCIGLKQTMSKCELLDDENNKLSDIEISDTMRLDNHVLNLRNDEYLKLGNVDEVMSSSKICEGLKEVNNSQQESKVINWSETMLDKSSEPGSSIHDNQQSLVAEDYAKKASLSSVREANLEVLDFKKNERKLDFNSVGANENVTPRMFFFPEKESYEVVKNAADIVPGGPVGELRREDVSVTSSFQSQTCGTESCMAKVLEGKESKSDEFVHSAFIPRGNLEANLLVNEGLEKTSASWLRSPQGSKDAPTDSNMYGTCNPILDEPNQEKVSKSILSSFSSGELAHGVSELHDTEIDVTDISSARNNARPSEFGKHGNSGASKVIYDFGGGVSGINNTGVLTSVPPDTVPDSSSAFSLWNDDQTFGVENNQSRVSHSTGEESRQERLSRSNSLRLAGFHNMGYNLNESYNMGTVENFSRLNNLEQSEDTDLMIGFKDTHMRPNQGVANETVWRNSEENSLPSGLGGSSSEQGQVSGVFRSFDFLSDKGDNDVFSMNEKFDSMASFDGLRSSTVEPMEFSFLTPQDSDAQLDDPKVLSYANAGIEQGFDSSLWIGRENSMPNLSGVQPVSTVMCVWCGSEFQQESIDSDTQTGSIGYLCPACKAKISGQYL